MTKIMFNYPKSLQMKKEMEAQHYLPVKFILNSEVKKIKNILEIKEESILNMDELEYFEDTNKSDWEIGFLKKIITNDDDDDLMYTKNMQISQLQLSTNKEEKSINIVQNQFEKSINVEQDQSNEKKEENIDDMALLFMVENTVEENIKGKNDKILEEEKQFKEKLKTKNNN